MIPETEHIILDPQGDKDCADFLLQGNAWLRCNDVMLRLVISSDELIVEALPASDVMATPYWKKAIDFESTE